MKVQRKSIIFASSIIGCLLSTVVLAEAQPVPMALPTIPEAVERYSFEAGILFNNPSAGIGLEALLQMGRKASIALVRSPQGERENILERLSKKDFEEVRHKMKGFFVNRDETVYVEPDPDFFIEIAKRAGDQPSLEFFQGYSKTIPNAWPIYIEQQTDYSGCIRYGSISLADTYARWRDYGNKFPTHYVAEVANFIRSVEDELAEGTCACGNKESVVKEFQAVIQAYPQAKIALRLRKRINQIQQGESDIREYCHSG